MRKADEILKDLLSQYSINLEDNVYVSVYQTWPEIAGIDLAAHIKIREIQGTQLLLEADHPGWTQLFKMQEKKILKEIRRRYPELGIKTARLFVRSN